MSGSVFGITPKPEAASATASAQDTDSPMAALRRRREKLAAQNIEAFDLPGYGGELFVRYRRLGKKDSNEALLGTIGEAWEPDAQFLLDACEGIYRRDDEDGEHPAWDGDKPAVSVSDAPQWADMNTIFEMGLSDGREIVLAVFAGNEHQLTEHADDVWQWMRGVSEPETEKLLGE